MPVILLFVHGWGFDADFWNDVAALLPDFRKEFVDRGYFGPPRNPEIIGPVVAITHSFGSMHILRDPPPGCRGLIAINGFDRFTSSTGFPGVSPRVVDRMIKRFDSDPETVLADFRHRCGTDKVFGPLRLASIQKDLLALRNMDCRPDSAHPRLSILSIQGAADPILPPSMRDTVFSTAVHIERATHPEGGHLLPLTDSEYCARAVRAFVEQVQ